MIKFNRFKLKNGLKVIVHEDHSTPLAAINILYNVGSKDEHPERTGFAHLFEHLMFGGSINIPDYDAPLQMVGGENNAFTNPDITNYYLKLPANNLETGFWLESDRMLSLAFSERSLAVQKKVVSEEFKERYLNQPYGDVWPIIRKFVYKKHPYQWPTIGKQLSHIKKIKIADVKWFFKKYYCPSNAILVVAGNVKTSAVKKLANKWFGSIPAGKSNNRKLPLEPKQKEPQKKTVRRDVPADSIYKVYHMCNRRAKEYYTTDLISDILSGGHSGRLEQELINKRHLFSKIAAFISGSVEEGMFMIEGQLQKGVKMKDAESAILNELKKLKTGLIDNYELQKVKNKVESSITFSEINILNRALDLAQFELLGNANLVNTEIEKYQKVAPAEIRNQCKKMFTPENCSTLYYLQK
ncbi:insulinase family protein [bacterium AH-315-C07]|nr:insulinase family protein [bacterium AH-315-C07]